MNPLDQDVDDDAPTLEYRVPARALVGPTASLPDVLNSREAATALRMGVKELRQLIERGELPAARLGPRRVIRIAKTAIVSLLRGELQWRLEHLPIMPTDWKLAVTTPDLLKTIKSLLPRASVVVNAGDPDREGQLLVDEVLVYLHYRGQVDRVLVSDMNPAAVRKALGAIQPNSKFKPLYDAAVGRQRADWLYGLNMTRLYTVLGRSGGYDGVLSVGRVQTPLLGLIVRRDLEIEKFVPKPYFSILADVAGAAQPFTAVWRPGADADSVLDPEGRLLSADFASLVERRTSGQPGTVTKASRERKAEAAPLPYSLADLQIDAGRRLGLGPKVVLDVCQALYETHRLTTYPRSDCRYLPEGHLAQASAIVPGIAGVEPKLADIAGAANLSLRSRAWNDAKVTAHHALIPTPRTRTANPLSKNERAIYGLIARRYLAQFFPPFEYFQLDAEITVAGQRFTAKGRLPIADGWKRVLGPSAERDDHVGEDSRSGEDDVDPESPLPPLQLGQTIRIARTQTAAKKTSPPRRFTAAALVQAMTGIARYVSSPQIKALLRETDGIGTPATQASIIQTLFERHFIEEQKRQIVSTGTGRALIRALPDVATQPDMTALWEASLRKTSEGLAPLEGFLDAVRRQLGELVERARCVGAIQLPGIETRPCTAPGCAGVLRARVGKAGRFWACSRYPDCTHTEPVSSFSSGHCNHSARHRHRRKAGAR
jgi:DNA topoisomerase III